MSAIVKGSISAIAKENGASLAETFVNVDALVLVDTSGSMEAADSVGGRTRYDQACIELAQLQSALPGKIGVISFSSQVMFCPTGTPHNFGERTDMAAALRFAKVADVPDMRFVLISDGQPDYPDDALAVARTYTNRIDTIFVGDEGSRSARQFLERLSAATGGQSQTIAQVEKLAVKVHHLLSS